MGFFDKLFGTKQPAFELEPVSEMMDEDRFWQMVSDSIDESGSEQQVQESSLITALEKLSPAEIIGFRLRTDKLLHDTYNSEMWCAGYIMNGGCSDDGFEYFRLWIISRERDVFENAKANPDSLVDQVDEDTEFYDFESLWYVANTAFEKKTGKDLYNYISDDFKYREGAYPNFEFTWAEDNEDSMKAICPNLFEKCWGKWPSRDILE